MLFLMFCVIMNCQTSVAVMLSDGYFDIFPLSKSLSQVFSVEVYYKICYLWGTNAYSFKTSEKFRLFPISSTILKFGGNGLAFATLPPLRLERFSALALSEENYTS